MIVDREQRASLTDRAYWDETWWSVRSPKLVSIADNGLRNQVNLAFHRFFCRVLQDADLKGASLIEVGCAQSKWLPYFAQVHGFAVTGIDYSELGCLRAEELLKSANCDGKIIHADMFAAPDSLRESFDIVLSCGLVEHFPDTSAAISACAAFAKPGGLILTIIPNISGIVGFGQRWVDRAVYDKHVPLDSATLRAAHDKCGLSVLSFGYLMSANFAVINHPNVRPAVLNRLLRLFLVGATGSVWALERIGIPIPITRFFSPYVQCVAQKPIKFD
jgi:2-polyprenyl-3-methyl-5-hydroxy-6-metoxy-1,4-benzoquinol methylase